MNRDGLIGLAVKKSVLSHRFRMVAQNGEKMACGSTGCMQNDQHNTIQRGTEGYMKTFQKSKDFLATEGVYSYYIIVGCLLDKSRYRFVATGLKIMLTMA